MDNSALPSGTVTFLFTDVEGGTKLAFDTHHCMIHPFNYASRE